MLTENVVTEFYATLDMLLAYLSHLHPTVSVGGDTLISIRFDYGEKMSSSSLSSVLDFGEKIAAEKLHRPILVTFDEFQEISRLSPDKSFQPTTENGTA